MNPLARVRNSLDVILWLLLAWMLAGSGLCGATEPDPADYVDPRIGNIAPLLVPTYPTIQQPNQMLRMYPIRKDYTFDQVQYFPLQVMRHRGKGILQMRVSRGAVSPASWKRRMAYDHDLEVVHPWLYETYLLEDDITVGFTPGRKAAIWRYTFPDNSTGNILIAGGAEMEVTLVQNVLSIAEQVTKNSKNPQLEPTTMQVWVHAELTDEQGRPATGLKVNIEDNRLHIEVGSEAPRTVLLKYALSYISQQQAKKNFDSRIGRHWL